MVWKVPKTFNNHEQMKPRGALGVAWAAVGFRNVKKRFVFEGLMPFWRHLADFGRHVGPHWIFFGGSFSHTSKNGEQEQSPKKHEIMMEV